MLAVQQAHSLEQRDSARIGTEPGQTIAEMVLQQRHALPTKPELPQGSCLSSWTPRTISVPLSSGTHSVSTAPGAPQLLKPPPPSSTGAAAEMAPQPQRQLVPSCGTLSFCSTWVPAQLDTAPTSPVPHAPVIQLLSPPAACSGADANAARWSCSSPAQGRRRRAAAASPCSKFRGPPHQDAQPKLLSAPVRSTIVRRRSQEDLRIDRVLDSMRRSPSYESLLACRAGVAAAAPLIHPDTRAAVPMHEPSNLRDESVSFHDKEVHQAEKDVSKLMAEMAEMAC